jgi:hypothetical protein
MLEFSVLRAAARSGSSSAALREVSSPDDGLCCDRSRVTVAPRFCAPRAVGGNAVGAELPQ